MAKCGVCGTEIEECCMRIMDAKIALEIEGEVVSQ